MAANLAPRYVSTLGVGLSNPVGPLHVFSSNLSNALVVTNSGYVGIGTSAPIMPLHVYSGGNALMVSSNACVGIANSNPVFTLDVLGDINITGNYRVNGAVFPSSGSTSNVYSSMGSGASNTNLCQSMWYTTANVAGPSYIGLGGVIAQNNTTTGTMPFSATTGLFTCQYNGVYQCSITTGVVATKDSIYLYKNGVSVSPSALCTGNTNINNISGSVSVYCNAGDTLGFYISSGTCTGSALGTQCCSITMVSQSGSSTGVSLTGPTWTDLLVNGTLVFSGGYTYTSASFLTASAGTAIVSYSGTGYAIAGSSGKITATISLYNSSGTQLASRVSSIFSSGGHASFPEAEFSVSTTSSGSYYVGIVFSNNMISDANDSHNLSVAFYVSGVSISALNQATTVSFNASPDYFELLQNATTFVGTGGSFIGGSTYTSASFTTAGGSIMLNYSGAGFANPVNSALITATVSLLSGGTTVSGTTKTTSVYSSNSALASFPALEYVCKGLAAGTYKVKVVFSSNMSCDTNCAHNLTVMVMKESIGVTAPIYAVLSNVQPTSSIASTNITPDYFELLQNSTSIVATSGSGTYTSSSFATQGGTAQLTYSGCCYALIAGSVSATVSILGSGGSVVGTRTISSYSTGVVVSLPTLEFNTTLAAGTYTARITFSGNTATNANCSHSLVISVFPNAASTTVPSYYIPNTYSTINCAPSYVELFANSNLTIGGSNLTYTGTILPTFPCSAIVRYSGSGYTVGSSGLILATVTINGMSRTTEVYSLGAHTAFPALEFVTSLYASTAYTVTLTFSSNVTADANDFHSLNVTMLPTSFTAPAIVGNLANLSNLNMTGLGNMGIGTNYPVGPLQVMGSGSYSNMTGLVVASNAYVGVGTQIPQGPFQVNVGTSNVLCVSSNAYVGVGNNNPQYTLDVSGTLNCVNVNCSNVTSMSLAGMVSYFALSNVPPSGWLIANGATVSRTTYDNLFAAIGTVYGAGNGATTFQIPDFRGYFLRALDMGAGIDSGRSLATVQQDAYLNHSHTASTTVTDPGHSHSINDPGHSHGSPTGPYVCFYGGWNGGAPNDYGVVNLGAGGNYAHTYGSTGGAGTGISINGNSTGITVSTVVNASATGGSETRPKNVALLVCIKY